MIGTGYATPVSFQELWFLALRQGRLGGIWVYECKCLSPSVAVPLNTRLYACGLIPVSRLNWSRKEVSEPKPTWRAIHSIECPVVSSKDCALIRKALDNPRVTVAAVCGGSLALAMAGLLEGRHVVTHHMGMDVLETTGAISIYARVVDDGDLITAGGVTSGLDLGLYLLERELGPRIAHAYE